MKRTLLFILIISFIIPFSFAQIKYAIIPESPQPGEPVTIGINGTAKNILLHVNERQLAKASFFPVPADNKNEVFLAAVITIPSTADPGEAVFILEDENGTVLEIPVIIKTKDFISEVIPLNPVLTGIRTDPSQQRIDEANLLWQILSTTGDQVYHTGPFLPPVVSTRRTSTFGSRRVYEYSDGTRDVSIHAGVDYGVPTGTRVDACGTGRVVLARMRIVTGNSIIIEHAPGIYSLYYHLHRIDVKEGDIVKTGTRIGLSGSTGLSTGPHLHWEIRVNTENTDPDAFVHRLIIDKNQIISKIFK